MEIYNFWWKVRRALLCWFCILCLVVGSAYLVSWFNHEVFGDVEQQVPQVTASEQEAARTSDQALNDELSVEEAE